MRHKQRMPRGKFISHSQWKRWREQQAEISDEMLLEEVRRRNLRKKKRGQCY